MSNNKLLILAAMFLAATSVCAQEGPFLAERHAVKGLTCENCHVKGTTDLIRKETGEDVCVTCHGDYAAVYKLLEPKYDKKDLENPHGQHDGNLPCTECHKGHKEGKNYCLGCHSFEFKVP